MSETKKTGLDLLREPFPAHQISKLPKESKAQADERKSNRDSATNCTVCGGWHHKRAVHLDYVGHAALTDRLLDADAAWTWEPVALSETGLPQFDQTGGLWIRLTVCGVSRLGYGNAANKPQMDAGSREKEVIGDALRNAAMRFGAALDLWHKGQLHADEDDEPKADQPKPSSVPPKPAGKPPKPRGYAPWVATMEGAAKRGTDDLRIAYGLGNKEVAAYLNEHEPDVLTALQDTAKNAKPAASAA